MWRALLKTGETGAPEMMMRLIRITAVENSGNQPHPTNGSLEHHLQLG